MSEYIPDTELKEDFESVVDELNRVPLKTEYNNYGTYSASTLVKKFDDEGMSYDRAVRNIGYEPSPFDVHDVPTEVITDEINRIGGIIEFSEKVQQTAQKLVIQWSTITNISMSRIESVAAASLVLACKMHETPYSIKDIEAKVDTISQKTASRVERQMARELSEEFGLEMSPNQPEDYIDRFIGEAELSETTAEAARDILDVAREGKPSVFSGRSPVGVATAAIWLATYCTEDNATQAKLSRVANTTQVTIRNNASEIREAVDESDGDFAEILL